MTKFVAALVISRAVLISEDDCELVSSLAINEGTEGLMVFPNPTTGILNVFFEKQVADVSLTIRDAMGKIVFNGLLSAKKNNLDVGHLQSGVYWLSLENGEEFIFRRIILF